MADKTTSTSAGIAIALNELESGVIYETGQPGRFLFIENKKESGKEHSTFHFCQAETGKELESKYSIEFIESDDSKNEASAKELAPFLEKSTITSSTRKKPPAGLNDEKAPVPDFVKTACGIGPLAATLSSSLNNLPSLIFARDSDNEDNLLTGIKPSVGGSDRDIQWLIFKDGQWQPAEADMKKNVISRETAGESEYIKDFITQSGANADSFQTRSSTFDTMFGSAFTNDEAKELFATGGALLKHEFTNQSSEPQKELPSLVLAKDKANGNSLLAGVKPGPGSKDKDIEWLVFKDRKWQLAEPGTEVVVVDKKDVKAYIDTFKAQSGTVMGNYENRGSIFNVIFDEKDFMGDAAKAVLTDVRRLHLRQDFIDRFSSEEAPAKDTDDTSKPEAQTVHVSLGGGVTSEVKADKGAVAMTAVVATSLLAAIGIGAYALKQSKAKPQPAQQAQGTEGTAPAKPPESWVKKALPVGIAAALTVATVLAVKNNNNNNNNGRG